MTSSNGNIFRVTGLLCGEVTGEFPSQRPVTRSFEGFLELRLNKRLSKQSWGWWFESPSCPLWRHCNVIDYQWFYLSSLAQNSNVNAYIQSEYKRQMQILKLMIRMIWYIFLVCSRYMFMHKTSTALSNICQCPRYCIHVGVNDLYTFSPNSLRCDDASIIAYIFYNLYNLENVPYSLIWDFSPKNYFAK